MQTTAIRVARSLLWLVYAWVALTVVLLFLGFVLLLFGANPDAGFVEWIYRSTQRSMAPFRGIFESVEVGDQSVLDTSMLFAIIVYVFVALGLNLAVEWVTGELRTAERRQRPRDLLAAQAAAGANTALGPGQIVQLTGTTGAGASAVLTPYAWGTSVELTAMGLEPGRHYEVWLESRGGGRVSAGSFQPDTAGRAQFSLGATVALGDSVGFGLTALVGPGGGPVDVLVARLA